MVLQPGILFNPPTQQNETGKMDNPIKATAALDALRSLAQKKPAEQAPSLTIQVTDPAISGAKRDKNTVKLGVDPNFTERAGYSARLKAALERAQSDFEVIQAELRDYGRDKRKVYNDTYKTNVTTVGVPYKVDSPEGEETRYVQVICSNKYSVQKDAVLANRETIGQQFDRLFSVEETKKLKPNAEKLIRDILIEQGITGETLEAAMDTLLETEQKVTTTEAFEQEAEKLPQETQTLLNQLVTRAQPGLKFTL
jgi:hypothetical protein